MYKVRIFNSNTQEIMETQYYELEVALAVADVAYFSAQYEEDVIHITVHDIDGTEIPDWWELSCEK